MNPITRIKRSRRAKYGLLLTLASVMLLFPIISQALKGPTIIATGTFTTNYEMPYHSTPIEDLESITASFHAYQGMLNGYTAPDLILTQVPSPFGGSARVQITFSGTLNGSETGTFKAIMAGSFSKEMGAIPGTIKARIDIIPRSGTGGLKDICGSGTLKGEGNGLYMGTYTYELRRGEACNPK